jgi:hypothetical protein
MLFGWRLWKICVMLSFGLIGAGIGATLAGNGDNAILYTIGGGAMLGLLSYWPLKFAVSLLGGLIGCVFVTSSLAGFGLTGPALWIASGCALFACTAAAFLYRRHVVIAVTAFLGAALVLSGLTVWVMRMPGLYSVLHGLADKHFFILPFLHLVPTVMSCFYQGAEAKRCQAQV